MTRKKLIDLAERAAATFVQAFVAIALVSGVSDLTALKAAGVAGALAVGKFASAQAAQYLSTPDA